MWSINLSLNRLLSEEIVLVQNFTFLDSCGGALSVRSDELFCLGIYCILYGDEVYFMFQFYSFYSFISPEQLSGNHYVVVLC